MGLDQTRKHIQQRYKNGRIPMWPNFLDTTCRFCLPIPKLVYFCARSYTAAACV